MSVVSSPARQLLLPGQAAAPEGPCDLNAMYVIHHAFRRDLDRFARAAAVTPLADQTTWQALLVRWDRFAHLLHEHHAKEDEVLWPLLLGRADAAGDAAARRVLEDMEAEHDLIDPALSEIRLILTEMSAGAGEPVRVRLCGAVQRAGQALGHHLGHEEREAVLIMQRYIDGPEWTRLENGPLRGKSSLSELLYFLPWVAEGLDGEVLTFLLKKAGLPFRVFLRLGHRRFATLERAAFAHLSV